MLGSNEKNKRAALSALRAFPNGLQIGGGINPDNAKEYLDQGATHVIVTSYVFRDGRIDFGTMFASSAQSAPFISLRIPSDNFCAPTSQTDWTLFLNAWEKLDWYSI